MQNCRINNLIFIQSGNQRLVNAFELIKPYSSASSLAAYNKFEFEELLQFRRMFCHELDDTITDSKIFSGELLSLIKNRVNLPDDLHEYLITYYNEIYSDIGVEFISMTDLIERNLQNNSSK